MSDCSGAFQFGEQNFPVGRGQGQMWRLSITQTSTLAFMASYLQYLQGTYCLANFGMFQRRASPILVILKESCLTEPIAGGGMLHVHVNYSERCTFEEVALWAVLAESRKLP